MAQTGREQGVEAKNASAQRSDAATAEQKAQMTEILAKGAEASKIQGKV